MKIRLDEREITLNPEDASLCRKLIVREIKEAKKAAVASRSPAWFFTYLIMMHAVSGQMLGHFDTAMLSDIMEKLNADT